MREARVVEAALARADAPQPLSPSARALLERLIRVQIEAAKDLQRAALDSGLADRHGPDLHGALRPALLRIGDRISLLSVRALASTSRYGRQDLRDQLQIASRLSAERTEQIVLALDAIGRAAGGRAAGGRAAGGRAAGGRAAIGRAADAAPAPIARRP